MFQWLSRVLQWSFFSSVSVISTLESLPLHLDDWAPNVKLHLEHNDTRSSVIFDLCRITICLLYILLLRLHLDKLENRSLATGSVQTPKAGPSPVVWMLKEHLAVIVERFSVEKPGKLNSKYLVCVDLDRKTQAIPSNLSRKRFEDSSSQRVANPQACPAQSSDNGRLQSQQLGCTLQRGLDGPVVGQSPPPPKCLGGLPASATTSATLLLSCCSASLWAFSLVSTTPRESQSKLMRGRSHGCGLCLVVNIERILMLSKNFTSFSKLLISNSLIFIAV